MSSLAHAQTMAAYNRWMNERLYALCAELSDEERKRDRQAFFRSIHGTLNHLLLTDRLWFGRFTGELLKIQGLDQELYADFAELRRQRERTDAALTSWVASLSDERLAAPFTWASYTTVQTRTLPRGPCSRTSSTTRPTTAASSRRWSSKPAATRASPT